MRHVGIRSNLTCFLGPDSGQVEIVSLPGGDARAYLLATDGVWELFDTHELAEVLRPLRRSAAVDPEVVADRLQAEVQRRDPDDNATFVLVVRERGPSRETGRYPCLARLPAFVPTVKEAS